MKTWPNTEQKKSKTRYLAYVDEEERREGNKSLVPPEVQNSLFSNLVAYQLTSGFTETRMMADFRATIAVR